MAEKFRDGIAERLRDQIFGATDGTISTLAVVAGVSGADVSNFIVLIAGASAMLAEAISMGFSSYISTKVKRDILSAKKRKLDGETPGSEGVLFWLFTMFGGFVPIIPFLLPIRAHLIVSVVLSMIFLFAIGAYAGKATRTPWLKKGLQTAAIGFVAAAITYVVGYGFTLIR